MRMLLHRQNRFSSGQLRARDNVSLDLFLQKPHPDTIANLND